VYGALLREEERKRGRGKRNPLSTYIFTMRERKEGRQQKSELLFSIVFFTTSSARL